MHPSNEDIHFKANTTSTSGTAVVHVEVQPTVEQKFSGANPTIPIPIIVDVPKSLFIDVEGNNAKSSFRLAILIGSLLLVFGLGLLSFLPFLIVWIKYRKSKSEKAMSAVAKSRWITFVFVIWDFLFISVAIVAILIALFARGIISRPPEASPPT